MRINDSAVVSYVSPEDLYKTERVASLLKMDKIVFFIRVNHLCTKLADMLADMILNPQNLGNMKVVFFSKFTYNIVKSMVAEDYQLVLSMIGNEDPDDYNEYHPCLVGLCPCGVYTGFENIN